MPLPQDFMAEFLRKFGIDVIERLRWQEMVNEGKVIGPKRLREFLIQVNNHLITAPGPNLATRRRLAPEWFGWWVDYQDTEVINLFEPERPQSRRPESKSKAYERTPFKALAAEGGEKGSGWVGN